MTDKSQNQEPSQSQEKPSTSSTPKKPLPKVDPSKTISYRQDGADGKLKRN